MTALLTSTKDFDSPATFYSVRTVEGRSFVIQYPYAGPDGVFFEVHPNHTRPCKILGYAPRGSIDRTITAEEANKIMVEDD